MTAMLVGTALALAALAYVLWPLLVQPKTEARGDRRVCAKCREALMPDAVFCSNCGERVSVP